MAFVGADAVQLEQLASRMCHAADRLDAIRAEVRRQMETARWHGGDADEFRSLWNHRCSPILHSTAEAGRRAADVLRRNAHQQRVASEAYVHTQVRGPSPYIAPGILAMPILAGHTLGETAGFLFGLGGKATDILELLQVARPGLKDSLLLAGHEVRGLGAVGRVGPLTAINAGIDLAELAHGLATDPSNQDTYKAAMHVVFDAAGIAVMVAAPELIPVVIGAQAVYDFAEMVHPGITKDVVDGAAHVVAQSGEAIVHGAEQAADVAGDVISGGWHAVSHFFH